MFDIIFFFISNIFGDSFDINREFGAYIISDFQGFILQLEIPGVFVFIHFDSFIHFQLDWVFVFASFVPVRSGRQKQRSRYRKPRNNRRECVFVFDSVYFILSQFRDELRWRTRFEFDQFQK